MLVCSLLLDLQGEHATAVETYHMALGAAKSSADLRRLWLCFLRRSYGAVQGIFPWSKQNDRNPLSVDDRWAEFVNLVNQALTTLPTKIGLPHDGVGRTWVDYAGHNEVIDFYTSCLSDGDAIVGVFERFLRCMPSNVGLASR